jgi:hypothetical protein
MKEILLILLDKWKEWIRYNINMESMWIYAGMVIGWIVCYIQMKYGKDMNQNDKHKD